MSRANSSRAAIWRGILAVTPPQTKRLIQFETIAVYDNKPECGGARTNRGLVPILGLPTHAFKSRFADLGVFKMQALCNGCESRFIEPLTPNGEPPNPRNVHLPLTWAGSAVSRPPRTAGGNLLPAPLMLNVPGVPLYFPCIKSKSESSKLDKNIIVPAILDRSHRRATPAAENWQ